MKLYRVTCRGMTARVGNGTAFGVGYVVAENPSAAYDKMRQVLDKNGIGFQSERALDKIELLAEATEYPDCGMVLYL